MIIQRRLLSTDIQLYFSSPPKGSFDIVVINFTIDIHILEKTNLPYIPNSMFFILTIQGTKIFSKVCICWNISDLVTGTEDGKDLPKQAVGPVHGWLPHGDRKQRRACHTWVKKWKNKQSDWVCFCGMVTQPTQKTQLSECQTVTSPCLRPSIRSCF